MEEATTQEVEDATQEVEDTTQGVEDTTQEVEEAEGSIGQDHLQLYSELKSNLSHMILHLKKIW